MPSPRPPIRVLLVDDAVVVRHLVSEALDAEPDIEVVGVAANGKIALERVASLKPDLMVLDLEMPVMDGLQTLIELRKLGADVKVIVFSALTDREARRGLEALSQGASDVMAKPSNDPTTGSGAELAERIRNIVGHAPRPLARPTQAAPPPPSVRAPRPARGPLELIVIGTSTGGPNALVDVFSALPADLPAPVCVVQHMPPTFTAALAERLDRLCPLHVREAAGGEPLLPGQAFIAPGARHMVIARGQNGLETRIDDGPPENACKPAVDPLFRSAAALCGPGVLAAVLTGMGNDGQAGSQEIRTAGGHVLAQDEETSVVWGMPGHVVRAGQADAVLPLQSVGPELARIARQRAQRKTG